LKVLKFKVNIGTEPLRGKPFNVLLYLQDPIHQL